MKFKVRIEKDNFAGLSTRVNTAVGQVVRKTAYDIQAEAQMRAPVDTGAMKASIYVVTDQDSDRDFAYQNARSANPEVELHAYEETKKVRRAVVAVGARYGLFVERGTSRHSPRPFLQPAAELYELTFYTAIGEAIIRSVQ